MTHELIIQNLLEEKTIEKALCVGSSNSEAIQELQLILFELGYGKELKWAKTNATGVYDKCTEKAVKSFAKKNNIWSDGKSISEQLAKVLLHHYDILDEMQMLYGDMKNKTVSMIYTKGSSAKPAISSLQTLLNEVGYGAELKWDQYQNDGDYGNCTCAAVQAFSIYRGFKGDGNTFDRKMAKSLLKELAFGFGKEWYKTRKSIHLQSKPIVKATEIETLKETPPPTWKETETPIATSEVKVSQSALVTYDNTHFTGKQILCDIDFIPALERIHSYLVKNNIKLLITSSFRTSSRVAGAVVTPARMSNHMAGHAIDFNIKYGPGFTKLLRYNDMKLRKFPPEANAFFEDVRKDPMLRWGGDFTPFDPIHIDDHLNKDKDKWLARHLHVQEARDKGWA
ncbi:M15 family metallopeptidase [Flammeovirgaceae bacterium SG7u.111]|nr:M15 family metallopeptidase [Flammeovirgaceae bacterium SG7u.132]WPO37352.1 M15 family metallopeptidase [Flammeovirgaceae bacterium SG7u.111]